MSIKDIVYHVDNVFALWDPIERDDSICFYDYNPIPESSNVISMQNGFLKPNTRCVFDNKNTADKSLYSRAFIDIVAQVYDSSSPPTIIQAPANCLLSNNFPMFDQGVFKLGNSIAETTATLLAEKSLVKCLLDYSDNDKNSFLPQLWAPDSGSATSYTPTGGALTQGSPGLAVIQPTIPYFTSVNATGNVPNFQNRIDSSFNEGALSRYKYTWSGWSSAPYTPPANPAPNTLLPKVTALQGTGMVNLRIPIYRLFDFLTNDKFYSGVSARIELVIGPNQQNLFQILVDSVNTSTYAATGPVITNTITYVPAANAAGITLPYQLKILSMTLMVPVVRPVPSLNNELDLKMSQNQTTSFAYRYCEPWTTSYPLSTYNVNWLINSTSEKVDYILIGFRWQGLINDPTQVQNSQVFHNLLPYIIRTYISMGSLIFPKDSYQPQLNQGSYGPVMAFNKLLDITNRTFDYEGGMALNWSKFYSDGVYCLIPFDTRYTDENSGLVAGQSKEIRYFSTFSTASPALPNTAALQGLNIYAFIFSTKEISTNLVNGATQLIG